MATIATDQALEAAKETLSRGDWFEPITVRAEIDALKKVLAQSLRPDLTAQITVAGQIISFKQLLADLAQFNRALNSPLDDRLFSDLATLKPEHLTVLEKDLAAVTAPPETEKPMDAVVPTKAKLQELQDILKAQAETTASIKDRLGRPSQLQQQIEQAQEIGIRAQLLRVAVSKNLFTTLNESSYIRDLQTIYGKEAINQLLAKRIDLAVNHSVTALALNQLGVSDPSQAAIYFTSQLEKNLKADRNLAVALAKTNRTDRKNALADTKNLAEEAAKEIDPAARAYRAEQNSSPLIRANAENIAKGEIETALIKSGRSLTKKQAGRLAEALAKYSDQPKKQLLILKRILPAVTPEARQQLIEILNPAISALAKSSDRPTISETINENSLVNLARTNPEFFPPRFVWAVRSGKLSTGETSALIARLSMQLGQPPDYVAMLLSGVTPKNLEAHLNSLVKGKLVLGLPTQPPILPSNPIYGRLGAAQSGLNQIQSSGEEFRAVNLGLQNSWHSIIQTLDIGKAFGYNFGRLPPVNRMVSSVQTVFSGLRVQSGAVNSVFNFFSSVSGGFGKLGSAASYPFRAVGSMVSTGWNNVKTWAGTQVKAGLAKAGAWLMKTVGPEMAGAAAQLGLMAVGKGAAALLAQAVPIAGQIAAVGLIGGNILKFLWDHKKEIGMGLGGMFFLGQMLLSKFIGLLSGLGNIAAWTVAGAAFGTIIPGIGTLVGGLVGLGIGVGTTLAGGTSAVLAGLGSALGTAAAGLSSFIGSLTAPSLVAGLGTTIATVGIGGIIGAGILDTFFVKPRTDSAMFVPTEKSSSAPRDGGGYIPPDIVAAGTCPLVENPSISTGTLGSGLGRSEHGGRGYGFHCYGIPIKSVWRWNEDMRTTPKSNPNTGTACDVSTLNSCNDNSCPYYGFATDVESTSNSNPTIRLPIICSDTATDISQCQPMAWTVVDHFYNCYGGSTDTKEECEAKSFAGISDKHDQLWGWGTIFESHDNGHYWRLYLNHYEKTVNIGIGSIFRASLEQADTIGYIPADNYVKHLHYELVMDDNPIRPDFLCDGSAEQPPVNTPTGWVAKVNGANNLVATTNAEYMANNDQGQPTCSWMDGGTHDSVTVATNANFWGYVGNTKSPRGPASYQNDPIGHSLDSSYEFWTVYVDGSSTRLTPAEANTSSHLFAVSGTPLLIKDGTEAVIPNNPEWNKRVNRVGFGFTNNTYYLVFLQNAYVIDLQATMINLGVKNAINLDGGSKASLCSRSGGEVQKIVSQGASVPVSVGLVGGTIEPYSPAATPTPTQSRVR